MFFYVYILQSIKDRKLYVGCTNDLRRRLKEHNEKQSCSTKSRAPFELVYYEAYRNRKDAEKRECFFKTGWGRNYVKKLLEYEFSAKI